MWEDIGGWTRAELDRADLPNRRWIRREIARRRFFGFLFETADRRVAGSGSIWLQPAQPRPGRLAGPVLPYIMSMYTEPAYRGRSVASHLVRAMVDWCERRGYRRVVLHASAMGRPLYERLGFVPSNEMRLDLPVRRGRGGRARGPPARGSGPLRAEELA